jgi:hypothetical protein
MVEAVFNKKKKASFTRKLGLNLKKTCEVLHVEQSCLWR